MHAFRSLSQYRSIRNTVLMLAAVLIVLPAALSVGREREDAQVAYVVKGAFNVAGSSVSVIQGNRHARRAGFVGRTIAFDLTAARVRVADVNGDGVRNAADLQAGDVVVVRARLPRSTPGAAPLAARNVVDQSHGREHAHGHGGDHRG